MRRALHRLRDQTAEVAEERALRFRGGQLCARVRLQAAFGNLGASAMDFVAMLRTAVGRWRA
eukprot:6655648-Prymnesium_polylepis.1